MVNIEPIGTETNKKEEIGFKSGLLNRSLAKGDNFSLLFENELDGINDKLAKKDKDFFEKIKEKMVFIPEDRSGIERMLFNVENRTTFVQGADTAANDHINETDRTFLNNMVNSEDINTGELSALKVPANLFAQRLIDHLDLSKLMLVDRNELKLDSFWKIKEADNISGKISFTDLYSELVKEIKTTDIDGIKRLRLTINPRKFGELNIFFVLDNKKLYISFAANEELRAALEKDQSLLRDVLQEHGYELENMEFADFSNLRDFNRDSISSSESNPFWGELLLNNDNKEDIINKINNYLADSLVDYFI